MMAEGREQLKLLTAPIPVALQSDTGRSGLKAADHTVSVQWLLASVGPYDFEIVEKLYSKPKKGGEEKVLNGVICRLTIEVDGRVVKIEEAGGLESAMNQDGDGERLKHLLSDALKRCAMRVGVGLNIWAAEHYFLHKALTSGDEKPELQEAAGQIPEDAAGPSRQMAEEAQPQAAEPSGEMNLEEEPLPSWLTETEATPESAYSDMKGAAARASEAKGKPGPGGDDGPLTEEQDSAIRRLARDIKGDSGVADFENKNGPISRLTKRQAREHIRQLGEVLQRIRKRQQANAKT